MKAPGTPKKIMIVAGEASGDLHGSSLVTAVHDIDPKVRFYGVGGKRMEAVGVELLARSADMAVVGITEVLSKLPFILTVRSRLKKAFKKDPPDLLIPIDYPDFNLPLAAAAKKSGVRVFYYISPQVWAWRKGRIATLKRIVDRMAVIFPFERAFYAREGMEVDFVGHPLLDVVRSKWSREEALGHFGLETGKDWTTVGILPGSRQSEVSRLLPDMLGAATLLNGKLHSVQFILPAADTLPGDFITGMTGRFPGKLAIVKEDIYDAVSVMDAAMVASGTATLETALLGTPMVIVYRVSPLTFALGRMFIRVDHIGIVNIIAGRRVVPELIQDDVTPEKMAGEVFSILENGERRDQMKRDLLEVREKLGNAGASARAARLVHEMLQNSARDGG